MRRFRGLALLAALLGAGCATYERGTLAAASTAEVPIPMVVIEEAVEGRSCEMMGPQFNLASAQALAKAPGANALVHVSYHFERFCMVVRGTAVRIGG
jgi:hypothetical protein